MTRRLPLLEFQVSREELMGQQNGGGAKESVPHVINTWFVVSHIILKIQNNLKGSKSFLFYNIKKILLELEIGRVLYIILKTSGNSDSKARRNHRRLYVMLYSYFNLKIRHFILFFIFMWGNPKA